MEVQLEFQPREYQKELWDAVTNQDTYKRHKFLAILPRRAGKDITAWNLAIRQCLLKPCMVMYALPTYSQARKCIFDAIAIDGRKFLDFCPKRSVAKINIQEMKIQFTNGSILQLIGADAYNTSLVGTNPFAIIISEAALCDLANVYAFARPILAANGGWILILSTPRGKNALFELYKTAIELDSWHVIKMGVSETKHIDPKVLAEEKAQMSLDLYLQEFEVSFDRGQQGSYYGRVLDTATLEGRIGAVPWDPGMMVYVAIDIGVSDATTMIFFQCTSDQSVIKIIDCYSNNNVGLDHYVHYLQSKPYRYAAYFAPHDLQVREWGGGAITRYEKARQLGINFTILDQIKIQDGIDNVLVTFPRLYIDKTKCKSLLDALENYRREWNEERQIYNPKPIHDWSSHYADCMRYLCQSLPKAKQGMSSQDFDKAKAMALYGGNQTLPRFFQDEPAYNSRR